MLNPFELYDIMKDMMSMENKFIYKNDQSGSQGMFSIMDFPIEASDIQSLVPIISLVKDYRDDFIINVFDKNVDIRNTHRVMMENFDDIYREYTLTVSSWMAINADRILDHLIDIHRGHIITNYKSNLGRSDISAIRYRGKKHDHQLVITKVDPDTSKINSSILYIPASHVDDYIYLLQYVIKSHAQYLHAIGIDTSDSEIANNPDERVARLFYRDGNREIPYVQYVIQ